MNTAQELLKKLIEYNDIESATTIYTEANAIIKEYNEVKKACIAIVERHLRETGELKGKTAIASYGWTQPKPKLQLNEQKWQEAITNNDNLWELVTQLEHKQKKVEMAQKNYMEEVYPKSRVYIK